MAKKKQINERLVYTDKDMNGIKKVNYQDLSEDEKKRYDKTELKK